MQKVLVCLLGVVIWASAGSVKAERVNIGPAQRTALGVTLYSNGLALISDRRKFELSSGNNELWFSGVSPMMVAESVQLKSDGALKITEQGLLPANLNHRELLKAYVGKTIKIIKTNPSTGEEKQLDAKVIVVEPNLILRIDGQFVTSSSGILAFPEIPKELRAKPIFRIVGRVDAKGPGSAHLQYLAQGLSWRADHVASFDRQTNKLNLQTRATLVNQSGIDLMGSHMQMIAGQVKQATPRNRMPREQKLMMAEAVAVDRQAPSERQAMGGFHLYSLSEPVDLPDRMSKQVSLLQPQSFPAKRILVSENQPNIYGHNGGAVYPSHPVIQIEFLNDRKSGAKQPLPSGILRLYGSDKNQKTQFLGEDNLASLPVGEKAKIRTGQAFDVTVRRKQTDFKRDVMGRNTFEAAFEITTLNGGNKPELVKLVENMSGEWAITEQSEVHIRDGNQVYWPVTVPAGGKSTITYRVRVRR